MKTNKKFNLEKQEILSGSRILKNYKTENRIDYFHKYAEENYLVKNQILLGILKLFIIKRNHINVHYVHHHLEKMEI